MSKRTVIPVALSLSVSLIPTLTLCLALTAGCLAQDVPPAKDLQIGQSFQVPYRLTDTNHFLVRVRVNGKGPFNFLVDSGAPALYIATETAARIGLVPPRDEFWTPVDRLDFEGGARLVGVKARVEDPFQLVGMNALGLPGASIDGILGFTILARFRLEIDPTRDRMTWTRLNFSPPDPPVPQQGDARGGQAPAGLQALNALGPIAKGLAFLIGKQPEQQRYPRGFLGLEWAEETLPGTDQSAVRVRQVVPGSPAAKAELQPGDQIAGVQGKPVARLADARAAMAQVRPGDQVTLTIRRKSAGDAAPRERSVAVTAGEGL